MIILNNTTGYVTISPEDISAMCGVMGFVTGTIDDEYMQTVPDSLRPMVQRVVDVAEKFMNTVEAE